MSKSNGDFAADDLVPIKSKFEADIVRFSISTGNFLTYAVFKKFLAERHNMDANFKFFIWYTDPTDGDLLPINNDSNYEKALVASRSLLRIVLLRKGDKLENAEVPSSYKKKLKRSTSKAIRQIEISHPQDFRKISQIIDYDILPKTCRRVRLLKKESGKPLGFYIKDGPSYKPLPASAGGGVEMVTGVFISRVIPGGLAESTGLLAVDDEVLEVNGIEVEGKNLDQVTDMMIANIDNLIITMKPAKESESMMKSYYNSLSHRSRSSTKSGSSKLDSDDEVDQIEIYHV